MGRLKTREWKTGHQFFDWVFDKFCNDQLQRNGESYDNENDNIIIALVVIAVP